jgi:surface protein
LASQNIPCALVVKESVDIDGKGSDVDLSHWDVSHVSGAHKAFYSATAFNQDIGSWDVSKVTDISYMFYNATIFNFGCIFSDGSISVTSNICKGVCCNRNGNIRMLST